MEWLNEPTIWKIDGDRIIVTSDPKTDFWCRTHSSRILDNGHFLFQTVKGDFKTEVRVAGEFNTLYDQAGLMMRLDAMHWIKCGIELANGIRNVSAVVTREWSDWSIIAFPDTEAMTAYPDKVLFLGGENSTYIKAESVYSLFPKAEIKTIENAGHWLHAEQPEAFCEAVKDFLKVM